MPFGVTSPKKQVNRRRLRMLAAQNLSLWGSETPRQIQWAFFCFEFWVSSLKFEVITQMKLSAVS